MTEQEILKFWQENNIFEKSVKKNAPKGDFVFYDGPPFATGTPHYGHIVASTMKDTVPRYWTMRGYRVERKWGWDCHGLPIENIAEKELGIKRKKEIEEMGIGKFNEFCRSKVLEYVEEWKKVIARLGRWADMEDSYKTMDLPFMESVWWVFKQLWEKGLIYEGYRSMYICTRCETTLSQQEVAEGYKNIKDLSATVKFELTSDVGGETSDVEKTFVLAWTTTPWTLIGNVALAVGEKIDYVKVKIEKDFFILAKERVADILKDKEYEIVSKLKGKDLVGKKYKPLFDYYYDEESAGWRIYHADFVTTEDGTGVVHIAPAFGEDDLNLGKKKNLPFIQHIGMDGIIKPEAKDFAGLSVKPVEDHSTNSGQAHQSTDVEIIKYLAKNNLLFAKEKYEHSYPHCWRCDTPLINYATSSWFVNILKIKERALELAKDINWSPAHIKEGRFGKWLEGARDWSISRQRYWASVIPVWKCEKCKEMKVVGSVDEIRNELGGVNKIFLVRHGEAENNVANILNSAPNLNTYHLTEKGKKQIKNLTKILNSPTGEEKIDLIFSSPLLRAKETAEIISKETKVEITFDERLREVDFGEFNGKTVEEFDKKFPTRESRSKIDGYGIETGEQIRERISDFLADLNKKYSGKNIIIVSHGDPVQIFYGITTGLKLEESLSGWYPENGCKKIVYSKPVDLHKHVVDKVILKCPKCDGEMRRVPDVLDTWFDSGSMPYAQMHYPFENKEKFEANFPAQFIGEGVDQTRAWFYYLHTIATAIKGSRAFSNVIVNGTVLAEDGKKMSKRLNNYPDPMDVINKYGADALRFYLLSSPVVKAENLSFSEKGVDEAHKKVVMRLKNVMRFFELYVKEIPEEEWIKEKQELKNRLDKWIFTRLNELILDVSENLEKYELDKAIRPIGDFIDDLSTWYLRRSRERFKAGDKDSQQALSTMGYALGELSKIIAPFMPFVAEEIYQSFRIIKSEDSVHLEKWPEIINKDAKFDIILQDMREVRNIASLGLEARAKAGIKVRQPLALLKVNGIKSNIENDKQLQQLILDEVNVKKIIFDKNITNEVELDVRLTPELIEEGIVRELTRNIQDLRKKAGLVPQDKITLTIETDSAGEKLIKKFKEEIKYSTSTTKIEFSEVAGEQIKIDELVFKTRITK